MFGWVVCSLQIHPLTPTVSHVCPGDVNHHRQQLQPSSDDRNQHDVTDHRNSSFGPASSNATCRSVQRRLGDNKDDLSSTPGDGRTYSGDGATNKTPLDWAGNPVRSFACPLYLIIVGSVWGGARCSSFNKKLTNWLAQATGH